MSDRLLTAGILQYQPARSKIYLITQSIFAMLSGDDIALAAELIDIVRLRVSAGIDLKPNVWWSVKETAEIWRQVYLERLARESETAILAPLGLTTQRFISENNQLTPSFVDRISNELLNFEIAGTSVIFAGSDAAGPHIYVAHNAHISCHDAVGYAAVGIGAHHARSQFITSSHTPDSALNRTVFVTYAAKRRAEAAPGVGKDTDTFYTWQAGLGSVLRDDIVEMLRQTYDKMERDNARTLRNSMGRVHDEISKITASSSKQPDQQQIPKDDDPPPSPNVEETRSQPTDDVDPT